MIGPGGINWSSPDGRFNSKRTFATLRKKATEHWAGINGIERIDRINVFQRSSEIATGPGAIVGVSSGGISPEKCVRRNPNGRLSTPCPLCVEYVIASCEAEVIDSLTYSAGDSLPIPTKLDERPLDADAPSAAYSTAWLRLIRGGSTNRGSTASHGIGIETIRTSARLAAGPGSLEKVTTCALESDLASYSGLASISDIVNPLQGLRDGTRCRPLPRGFPLSIAEPSLSARI